MSTHLIESAAVALPNRVALPAAASWRAQHQVAAAPLARRSGSAPVLAFLATLALAGCGSTDPKQVPNTSPGESPADLYVSLAAEYMTRGQMEIALRNAERAIAEDRRSGSAHYMLGIIQHQLGRIPESDASFAEALRLTPASPTFRNAWGSVLCRQGRYDEGLREIAKAAEDPLYQTPEIAWMNAADCARRARRPAEVDRSLRAAITANPRFAPALLALAQREADRGQYQQARELIGRYGQVAPATPGALLLAARIERSLGNAQGAQALEAALKQRYPNAPETMQL